MAAVTPTVSNHCRGTFASGDPDVRFLCLKEVDEDGNNVFACAGMRLFKANCPKINQSCSHFSTAYLPAITICYQRIF
jgi:hypothetical protein